MEQSRCIFCMHMIEDGEHLCPVCKKGIWEYEWKKNWLEPGTVLHGKYEIGAAMGEGPESVAYIGFDRILEQKIVIKEYSSKVWSEKMEKAARSLFGNFYVRGLVIEKDFFKEGGKGYIVIEYMEGGSLSSYLAGRHTKICPEEAVEMLEPVMEAAGFLHSMGMIHGSISPDHLLFDSDGVLHLNVFGGRQGTQSPYSFPEQQTDMEGPWSDVYSICAVMYEMITEKKVLPVVERIKKDRLKRPSAYTEISAGKEEVLMQGLSLDVQMRFFSAGGLAEAFGMEKSAVCRLDDEIRRVWGEEWLQITSQAEKSVYGMSGYKKKIRWKRMAAAGLAVLIFSGSAAVYLRTHQELIFQYHIKKAAVEKKQHPRVRYLLRGDPGYEEIRDFIEKYGEYEENVGGESFKIYSVPEKDLLKCSVLRGTYDTFYLDKDMMMDVVAYEMKVPKKDISRKDSMYYDTCPIYADAAETIKIWIWKSETYVINYEKVEEVLEIGYDVTDMQVKKVEFKGTKKRCEKFLVNVLPQVSPETYLTKEEAEEIMEGVNQEHHIAGIDLTAKCQLIVSYNESEEDSYSVTLSAEGV